MKKLLAVAFAVMFAISFISCGKKIDSTTWIDSYSDGLEIAKKNNKNMFVFFSALDYNENSAAVYEQVLSTPEFISKYSKDYVLVHLDFSESLYAKTEVAEDASKAEKKAAKELESKLDENFKIVQYLDVRLPPAYQIVTKDSYFITEFKFAETPTLADFDEAFESAKPEIETFENLLKTVASGSKSEKLEAINTIYDSTDPNKNYFLSELNKKYVEIDKTNETKLVSKHLGAIAYANFVDKVIADDFLGGIAEFAKLADSEFLLPSEKQDAYYSAAYYLMGSGSTDYVLIKDYLERAYIADSSSENAPKIQELLHTVEQAIAGFSADSGVSPLGF